MCFPKELYKIIKEKIITSRPESECDYDTSCVITIRIGEENSQYGKENLDSDSVWGSKKNMRSSL